MQEPSNIYHVAEVIVSVLLSKFLLVTKMRPFKLHIILSREVVEVLYCLLSIVYIEVARNERESFISLILSKITKNG